MKPAFLRKACTSPELRRLKARTCPRTPKPGGNWDGAGKLCRSALAAVALWLVAGNAPAALGPTNVVTLTGGWANHGLGGPYSGYVDGSTNAASFNFPAGLALTPAGDSLFIADCTNDAVRWFSGLNNSSASQVYTFVNAGNGISRPVAVAVDLATNVYVLNRANGTNGCVLEFTNNADFFDYPDYGTLLAYPAATVNTFPLTNASAMAFDNATNLYVVCNSNQVVRVAIGGVSSVIASGATSFGTNGPMVNLRGVTLRSDGQLALSDAGNNGIWLMTPTNNAVASKLTGFHGAGDTNGPPLLAAFNHLENIAAAGGGWLVVADRGNHKVKTIDSAGNVRRLFGVNSNLWWGYPVNPTATDPNGHQAMMGLSDGLVDSLEEFGSVQARQPVGLVFAPDGSIYDTEVYYHVIRHITSTGLPLLPPRPPLNLTATPTIGQVSLAWSPSAGATGYNVKRSPTSGGPYTILANVSATSYTDTNVLNGTTYYYVVTAVNSGGEGLSSAEVGVTVPFAPVPDPQIGYVDSFNVFHPVSLITFNNDAPIVVKGEAGTQIFYTQGNTLIASNVPDPTPADASALIYQDGLSPSGYTIAQIQPQLTIKAVATETNRPSSAVVTAQFQFIVGNPVISGDNAAQFTVNDITLGSTIKYTTDGSDPRTSPTAVTLQNGSSGTNGVSFPIPSLQFPPDTNVLTFNVYATKTNYADSSVATKVFSSSNFVPNRISFGFASGEASSDFIASPGQTFYAPVTLTVLPNTKMYSLQFNVTATNAGPNPGPALTKPPAPFGFSSMLLKPLPPDTNFPSGVQLYTPIPPMMFVGPAPNDFTNLVFTNLSANLLGVGWAERYTKTNLYNTLNQTLISYSQAHDDLFPNAQQPNGVIVGGYALTIPTNATPGKTYQIQIGRATATSDGVGAPGSLIYIDAPTNGSLAGGSPINALKIITVGQAIINNGTTNYISPSYIVGDVYPFRWFNAGDFGNTNLENADVEQVFETAIYGLNSPTNQAPGSDFFDAMDSCGMTYINNGYGYLQPNTPVANTSVLFDGNDTTINQIAFGDGQLDVCDVYVTYRRSLDPSLEWFRRFWTNDVAHGVSGRVAEIVPNVYNPSSMQKLSGNPAPAPLTNMPTVNFTAGDIQTTAGQTVQIPITAAVFGGYPLRVAMLNLSVVPLDGSPGLTTPVSFTPSAALGTPTLTDSQGPGNYAAAWLNSTIAGISNNGTIGTLTVTVPASATSLSAYAVHFDEASGSPNGLASFARNTMTGLITLSSRTNSSYGDGIPDAWRLRWFGTVNNLLSVSNACPSGDGVNNWLKYVAGVDPNVANDFPSVNAKTPPAGATAAIHWPSVSGKQYAVLSSPSLFPGSWTTNAIVTGTGTDMEFDDSTGGPTRFYRVQILP